MVEAEGSTVGALERALIALTPSDDIVANMLHDHMMEQTVGEILTPVRTA
jgi:hypothetical protein